MPTSTAKRVIKNTGYLYAKMGITMFISLYTTRLILNSLGTSDFGIFNIVGGAISMLGFLNAAMAGATQRFMSYSEGEGDEEKQKSIFNVSLVLHLGIAFIVGLALLIAGYIFFNGVLNIPADRVFAAKIVYGSLIISTMFTVMTVPYDAAMNAHENMKYYAVVGIIESLLKLSIAFVCVYSLYDKLIVYGVLMSCVPLVTLTIMRVYCHRNYKECKIEIKRSWNKGVMKKMTAFAGWNFLTSMSSMVTQYGLGIIINSFYGVLLNAAQGIANQVSGVLMMFSLNAQKALNPIVVKSEGAGENERFIYTTLLGCRISFFIFGFFSIPMMIEAENILGLWLGEVPQWAVIFCQLQLVRILIEQLTITYNSAIGAHGVVNNYSVMRSVLNFLPLVIVPLLFYLNYPPYFLYVIWIICWSLGGGIVAICFGKKLLGISWEIYFRMVLMPCLFTASISILLFYILHSLLYNGLEYRVLSIAIESVLYLLFSWVFIFQKRERKSILALIHKCSIK